MVAAVQSTSKHVKAANRYPDTTETELDCNNDYVF